MGAFGESTHAGSGSSSCLATCPFQPAMRARVYIHQRHFHMSASFMPPLPVSFNRTVYVQFLVHHWRYPLSQQYEQQWRFLPFRLIDLVRFLTPSGMYAVPFSTMPMHHLFAYICTGYASYPCHVLKVRYSPIEAPIAFRTPPERFVFGAANLSSLWVHVSFKLWRRTFPYMRV